LFAVVTAFVILGCAASLSPSDFRNDVRDGCTAGVWFDLSKKVARCSDENPNINPNDFGPHFTQ